MFYPFALWDFGKMDAVIRGEAGQNPRTVHTSFSAQVKSHKMEPYINYSHQSNLFYYFLFEDHQSFIPTN